MADTEYLDLPNPECARCGHDFGYHATIDDGEEPHDGLACEWFDDFEAALERLLLIVGSAHGEVCLYNLTRPDRHGGKLL